MHIIFDWDGTIAKPDVAKSAGMRRNKLLELGMDEAELKERMKTDGHFAVLTAHLSESTGITDSSYLTTMMTDVFRLFYHQVVHEMGEEVLYPVMRSVLEKLVAEKHELTIASTLRQDIIERTLEQLSLDKMFKGVYANTPDLIYSKKELISQAIINHGKGDWMVGDKMEDVESGRAQGTKTVFVDWGAGELVEFKPEIIAYKPEDLLKMLK